MSLHLPICVLILAFASTTISVSSKLDFVEEESPVAEESENKENEDVEVKHTIVVSTKLKNNNRRGLVSNAETSALTHNIGDKRPKVDSGEVPIVKAYKSVETTQIRTPDSRQRPVYSNYVPTSRSSRDEFDLYPNLSINQWKPMPFYKNINNWNQDFTPYTINRPNYQNINRRMDDGAREFYCKKCRELSGVRGCIQERSSWIVESTTPKIKIDGKIAKLN